MKLRITFTIVTSTSTSHIIALATPLRNQLLEVGVNCGIGFEQDKVANEHPENDVTIFVVVSLTKDVNVLNPLIAPDIPVLDPVLTLPKVMANIAPIISNMNIPTNTFPNVAVLSLISTTCARS
jgi:hypothetical protein